MPIGVRGCQGEEEAPLGDMDLGSPQPAWYLHTNSVQVCQWLITGVGGGEGGGGDYLAVLSPLSIH